MVHVYIMKVCWVAAVGWLLVSSGPVHWNRVALDPAPAFHFQSNVLNAILRVRLLLEWKRAWPGLLSRSSVPGVHPVSKYALWTHWEENGLIVSPVGDGRGVSVSVLLLRFHRGTLEQIVSALMGGVLLLYPGVHLCFILVRHRRAAVRLSAVNRHRHARQQQASWDASVFPAGSRTHWERCSTFPDEYSTISVKLTSRKIIFQPFCFSKSTRWFPVALVMVCFPFVRYGILLSLTFS